MMSVPAAGVMCPPSSSSGDFAANEAGNRAYLQTMSPNVAHKRAPSSKESTKTSPKRRTFSRPALPPLQSVSGPSRAHSTLGIRTTSPRKMLRRSNSSMSQGSGESSDRFIPSRHTTSGKITTTDTMPHPNASPQTHIRAQSSKIYQQHIAEACGLEVNARILQFQPVPPERKKPADLFAGINVNRTRTHLAPGAASARAKNIPSAPERVLDAPGLVDDFYLNLLAWSSTNLLAIGLEDAVYVWNASTGSVGLLCESRAMVTSLRWAQDGSYVSVGRDNGTVEIWDISSNQKLRTIDNGHGTRVAAQAWSAHILTAGSRTGSIYHSDVRMARHAVSTLATHTAEVCGIEYRGDGGQFSSGGNDNLVCIWDARKTYSSSQTTPIFSKSNHRAAVKALSWCPYQQSLLATGGGSSDKTIHFWNTSTGARINTIETESQISSLNWGYAAGTGMEIVATHGFPTNNISLFNYPTLQKTGEIVSAHDTRILSGCISPDYSTLATVSGDENLKFWSLFDANKKRDSVPHDETSDTKRMKKLMNIR
ncbi:WD repeat-containing protein slp1 [Meyerozyma guilliermondii]